MSRTTTSNVSPRQINSVTIRPRSGWQPLDLREIWFYRELFWILAIRDIKVRYKQTILGAAWAIIQPLCSMIIFTMIARFGNIPTDGIPSPLFYYCGMLAWLLFSSSIATSGNSLISNQNLITKIYFPRIIIPCASIVASIIDFGIALSVLIGLMIWYRVWPGIQIILLPAFVALNVLAATSVGIWLSALNVQFRDVRYVIPFVTQFWLFCTPILYSSSAVHTPWKRLLLGLNPMSGVVEGFRWCMLGRPTPGPMLIVSVAVILLSTVGCLFYFRRMERTFADRV
jgi:lipopolysaccharide transport system permease protein